MDNFEQVIQRKVTTIADLVRNGQTVTLRKNKEGLKITYHNEKTL